MSKVTLTGVSGVSLCDEVMANNGPALIPDARG